MYKCSECGSTDVEKRVWVDANNASTITLDRGDWEDTWCNQCGYHTQLKKQTDD